MEDMIRVEIVLDETQDRRTVVPIGKEITVGKLLERIRKSFPDFASREIELYIGEWAILPELTLGQVDRLCALKKPEKLILVVRNKGAVIPKKVPTNYCTFNEAYAKFGIALEELLRLSESGEVPVIRHTAGILFKIFELQEHIRKEQGDVPTPTKPIAAGGAGMQQVPLEMIKEEKFLPSEFKDLLEPKADEEPKLPTRLKVEFGKKTKKKDLKEKDESSSDEAVQKPEPTPEPSLQKNEPSTQKPVKPRVTLSIGTTDLVFEDQVVFDEKGRDANKSGKSREVVERQKQQTSSATSTPQADQGVFQTEQNKPVPVDSKPAVPQDAGAVSPQPEKKILPPKAPLSQVQPPKVAPPQPIVSTPQQVQTKTPLTPAVTNREEPPVQPQQVKTPTPDISISPAIISGKPSGPASIPKDNLAATLAKQPEEKLPGVAVGATKSDEKLPGVVVGAIKSDEKLPEVVMGIAPSTTPQGKTQIPSLQTEPKSEALPPQPQPITTKEQAHVSEKTETKQEPTASEESEIKRVSTARYYKRMYPFKNFPLMVLLSKKGILAPKIEDVAQVKGGDVSLPSEKPWVTVTPKFPGCLVVPPQITVDVTPSSVETLFDVTPIAEEGDMERARIDIYQGNELVSSIRTPFKICRQKWAKVSFVMSFLGPIITTCIEFFEQDIKNKWPEIWDQFKNLLALSGGINQLALLVGALFLILSVFLYFGKRPKRARPAEAFFEINE